MASLNGVHVPQLFDPATALVKTVGCALAVASGLAVGPEGPLVHVGACVASLCTRRYDAFLDAFHNDADGRDFLSAGVAAGLASAFGAPVGGVLFSLEEASTHWGRDTTWRSLTCSTLAVVALSALRALCPGEGAFGVKQSAGLLALSSPGLIPVEDDEENGGSSAGVFFLWELPAFALLAAVAGVVGVGVTRVSRRNARTSSRSRRGAARKLAEAAVVAASCAAVATLVAARFGACVPTRGAGGADDDDESAFFDDASLAVRLACPVGSRNDLATMLLGLRDDVISELLSDGLDDADGEDSTGFTTGSVAAALGFTLVATAAACDLALPGGLFMPTILWGALLGALFGRGARRLAPASFRAAPGAYALVGAASALAGVFRSSVSLVVIMLEGTGAVGALVPTLVGVAAANLAGDAVGGRGSSVYDEQLRDAGVPMLEETRAPREGGEDTTGRLAIDLVADAAPACLFPWETARRVERVLRETTHNGFPVVVPDDDTDEDADEDAASPLEEEDRAPRGASVAAHHRRGRLVGLVLRSQLIVLLARRALHPARGAREERSLVRLLSRPDARDPGANDALDAAARTFHHRKTFGDRVAATSPQAVAGVGLTEEERALRVDVGAFMHIAPLAVRDRCAAWRAARYARAAGLRHLPVVDERNVCVGVLTRANLVEAEGEDHI